MVDVSVIISLLLLMVSVSGNDDTVVGCVGVDDNAKVEEGTLSGSYTILSIVLLRDAVAVLWAGSGFIPVAVVAVSSVEVGPSSSATVVVVVLWRYIKASDPTSKFMPRKFHDKYSRGSWTGGIYWAA